METLDKREAVNCSDASRSFSFSLAPLFTPPPTISRLRLVRIDLWWCEIALVHIVFLYIFIIGAINLMKGLMSACRWCATRIQMNFVCKEKKKKKFSRNFIKLQLCVCERESVCISISTHMWMLLQTQLFFSQCVMFTDLLSALKPARECFEGNQQVLNEAERLVRRLFLFHFMNLLATVTQRRGN